MDGPNFQWMVLKFREGVKKEIKEPKLNKLIVTDSYNLYVVHGATKSASKKIDCGLKSLIKEVFQLLQDLPAHEEDTFPSLSYQSFFYSFVKLDRFI